MLGEAMQLAVQQREELIDRDAVRVVGAPDQGIDSVLQMASVWSLVRPAGRLARGLRSERYPPRWGAPARALARRVSTGMSGLVSRTRSPRWTSCSSTSRARHRGPPPGFLEA